MNAETNLERELNGAMEADLNKIRRGLDEALNAGEPKETNPLPKFAEKLAAASAVESSHSELDRFMANGERLLEQQRQRILAAESRYEVDRVKMVDYFRVRLRNLEHEACEAIRALDRRHAAKMADARKILEALTAMRG